MDGTKVRRGEWAVGIAGKDWSLVKKLQVGHALWCMPVIPATREAEAEESLEPRKRRL